jgi:hypothetical protein
MFSLERITRLIVIKRFAVRGVPANHVEIHSIVIGMALRTLLARRVRPNEGGMQAELVGNAVTDFRVAFDAF